MKRRRDRSPSWGAATPGEDGRMSNVKARITIIGSYAVGMTMSCARFPGEGETVTGGNFKLLHGGKGSNQAIAVARLGGEAIFGASVGADAFGDGAIAMLRNEAINYTHVSRKQGASTGVGIVLVSDRGSNEIVIDLAANELLSASDVEAMEEDISRSDVLLVQLEANLDAVARAVDIANERGITVILNPAPFRRMPARTIGLCGYITPNETEAAALLGLTGTALPEGSVLAGMLHEKYGNSVIVTLGESGSHVRTREVDRHVPARPARVIDTTGAGDTFSGALAVAIGEGKEILDAVAFATVAAGMSVEKEGVVESIPVRREVDARFATVARSAR